MKWIIAQSFFSVFCFFVLVNIAFAQLKDQPARLAILALKEITDDGLVDLLTAKLTGIKEIELVERKDIGKVIHKQEISTFFGTDSIGQRMEIGKILAAKRLLILKNNGETDFLDISFINAEIGVLLFQISLEKQESLCRSIAEIVEKVNSDFKDGPKAIICVPHFLSKSVSLDFLPHQETYANLLACSLMQIPGFAVVALDEYEAVQHEIAFVRTNVDEKLLKIFLMN